jgi:hypothetical protein
VAIEFADIQNQGCSILVKAHYRRAKARKAQGFKDLALQDAQKAYSLKPDDAEVKKMIDSLKPTKSKLKIEEVSSNISTCHSRVLDKNRPGFVKLQVVEV